MAAPFQVSMPSSVQNLMKSSSRRFDGKSRSLDDRDYFPPLLPYRWCNERLGSELVSGCRQKRGNLWLWVIMPTCCCVPGCSTRGGLSFPKDQRLRKLWIVEIKRNSDESRFKHWCPQAHSVVCHKHFRDEDFISVTTHGKLLIIYTELFVFVYILC